MYENIQVTIMEDDQPYGIQFYDGQGSYHLEIDIKDRDQRNILTAALASKHIPLFMGIKKERVHCDPLGQISDKMKPVAEELVNTLRKGISHYNSELQRIYQLIRDIILDIESRL